jgi:hypothetical protein
MFHIDKRSEVGLQQQTNAPTGAFAEVSFTQTSDSLTNQFSVDISINNKNESLSFDLYLPIFNHKIQTVRRKKQ